MLVLPAKRLELVAGGNLGKPVLWRLARKPSEKTRQRGAVAPVRRARPVEFGRVLARLRQQAGIGGAMDLGTRCPKPVANPGRGGRRIGLDPAAFRGQLV